MYRPTISRLIEALEEVQRRHGDLEVIGYNERGGEYPTVDVEMNDDDGPKIALLTVVSDAEDDD
jgi:hypothetical protein